MGVVTGPVRRGDGCPPAIILIDPKFPHNVGAAVRAASCYGIGQVWFTGDRVQLVGERRFRLPREERMRGYQEVELRDNAESLIDFPRPDGAVYRTGCGGRRISDVVRYDVQRLEE